MKKVLITGINGFVGSHLAEYVLENNLGEVYGTVRGKTPSYVNIEKIRDKINVMSCDLVDAFSTDNVIKEVQPDLVFHIAAQAFVPSSWKSPAETMNSNVMGSLNLFEAIRRNDIDPRIQIACSSEEYGLVLPNEVPIKETNPLRPLSPYGVSKVAMDLLGYQYFKSYGMKIVRTRAFNHSGPRRGQEYVDSNWARQVALIEKGKQKPELFVGSLTARRDFTHVRDIVRAYWIAATKATPGEVYNICTGKDYSMQEVLDMLLKLTNKKIKVTQDPERMRPSDVEILLGDCSKFKKETGWKPEISYEQTLKETLDYWRGIV
jgi:GDP-4-dehydro-6-deoxy-D-mannose reductase